MRMRTVCVGVSVSVGHELDIPSHPSIHPVIHPSFHPPPGDDRQDQRDTRLPTQHVSGRSPVRAERRSPHPRRPSPPRIQSEKRKAKASFERPNERRHASTLLIRRSIALGPGCMYLSAPMPMATAIAVRRCVTSASSVHGRPRSPLHPSRPRSPKRDVA